MTYRGDGFGLRMPSPTSIRSFSAANRGAFDIPVEATDERSRPITAWVRAVQHKPEHWSVSGLGFRGVTDAKVSETVASMLESRRPTAARRQAGELIEKPPPASRRPGRESVAAKCPSKSVAKPPTVGPHITPMTQAPARRGTVF